jgi:hypothetical protein
MCIGRCGTIQLLYYLGSYRLDLSMHIIIVLGSNSSFVQAHIEEWKDVLEKKEPAHSDWEEMQINTSYKDIVEVWLSDI